MEWLPLLAMAGAQHPFCHVTPPRGSEGNVERSGSRTCVDYSTFAARKPNQEALDMLVAPNGCLRRPPGITLRAVPFVGDDMERILRVHRGCHGIPASAGISSLGARSSDRQFTSDAVCPSALGVSLKMNRIDDGVHSWLPLWGGSTGASLCHQRRL